MAKDITIHFVGNARDLAASSAVAGASVDQFGNKVAFAGAKAEAASVGFNSLLAPLIALAAALVIVTAPITVLFSTFAALATGIVALAAVTGNLGDISGQAAASTQELAEQQQKLTDLTSQAAINQTKYNDAVKRYGVHSLEARQALITLHSSQQAVNTEQEKLNALQAQGQGPIAGLIAHVKDMANTLGQQAAPMAREFIGLLDRLIPTVTALGSQLIAWFGARLPTMLPIVTQIVKIAAIAVIGLFQAWGHMVDWFMAIWPTYSGAIGSVFSQIGTGVHFALPLLGLVHEAFVRLGPVVQFVRDHADSLKPVLYAVGALLVAMAASAMLTAAAVLLIVGAIVAVAAAISWAIAHINRIADAFWAVVHAAQTAANAISNAASAVSSIPVIGGALSFLEGHRQHGGPVLPGGIYTVGEAGTETLVMGRSGGFVIPGGGRGGGSGSTYNINVNVSPLANPADVGRAVVAAIQEYERRAGPRWRQ